ncbi:hypothetical protein AVEN_227285-1 [Araneus ventricosus]|uniref:Uncharacterized protein n=1 Tax=Araneus ventricosus TaxID=182803 RepID=A0A4Y2HFQ8_ARAVE|nr:hypothetical protein AVEN_227285-1 [Araneus ventricosus]
MLWREQQNHTTDCYFCSVDVRGFNTKNKKNIFYPNLSSAIRPVPPTSEIPVPHPPSSLMISGVILRMETHYYLTRTNLAQIFLLVRDPNHFLRASLMIKFRDLGLSKDGAELLGSRLKNKNLLTPGTSFSWYRHREKEFSQFFSKE